MESAEFTNEALLDIQVRPVERSEETRYQDQMAQHHYLGDLPKIGETLWYVATWRKQWVAQLSMSAAALKCGVRDRWIGWDFRSQYGRLKLIANNSRFLILPEWHRPNIGSRVLSLTERRVVADWQARLVIRCCYWRPLSIRGAFMAVCTARPMNNPAASYGVSQNSAS